MIAFATNTKKIIKVKKMAMVFKNNKSIITKIVKRAKSRIIIIPKRVKFFKHKEKVSIKSFTPEKPKKIVPDNQKIILRIAKSGSLYVEIPRSNKYFKHEDNVLIEKVKK